jgi:hypothetical protein
MAEIFSNRDLLDETDLVSLHGYEGFFSVTTKYLDKIDR